MTSENMAIKEIPVAWPVLTMAERRVLGVMVEKAKTTPDVYPMSLNSMMTGSNQKSNRDPVMNLSEEDVEETLAGMQPKGYVTRIQGGRVERWRHNLYDGWKVDKVELAILAELLLRGPQTEGELRQRASRMEPIDSLDDLRSALKPLAERGLVLFLGPEGRRGTLLSHGFHAPKELELLKSQAHVEDAATVAPMRPSQPADADKLTKLDGELQLAKQEIAALRAQMQQVQETLQYTKQQLQVLKDSLGGWDRAFDNGTRMDRLNKYLAHAGVGSRRHCEKLILAGRVSVDGRTVNELATFVAPGQKVAVDGEPIREENHVYWLVNKPRGYLCTNHDPSRRPLAVDLVPQISQRVYTVGRLDEDSEGLLLLTNDGDLAHRLMHPRFGIEKAYLVQVAGNPTPDDLQKLLDGVRLSDGQVKARNVKRLRRQGASTWLRIVLAEGKNREIRRMLAKLEHKVLRLRRIAIGPLDIGNLKSGKSRPLLPQELKSVKRLADKLELVGEPPA